MGSWWSVHARELVEPNLLLFFKGGCKGAIRFTQHWKRLGSNWLGTFLSSEISQDSIYQTIVGHLSGILQLLDQGIIMGLDVLTHSSMHYFFEASQLIFECRILQLTHVTTQVQTLTFEGNCISCGRGEANPANFALWLRKILVAQC